MAVSYNRLFKMLIDRKMMKKELCELADVSPSTISKIIFMSISSKLSNCNLFYRELCCTLISG